MMTVFTVEIARSAIATLKPTMFVNTILDVLATGVALYAVHMSATGLLGDTTVVEYITNHDPRL